MENSSSNYIIALILTKKETLNLLVETLTCYFMWEESSYALEKNKKKNYQIDYFFQSNYNIN